MDFSVQNTGSVNGAEVAQLYLGFPSSAGEPPKQLKGFEKMVLNAGAMKPATITLNKRAFSVWDIETHAWKVIQGKFGIFVGSSSRDIRLTSFVTI